MDKTKRALVFGGLAAAGFAYWKRDKLPSIDEILDYGDDKRSSAATGARGLQYIVLDANTGRVVLERNANEQREPASLTKLMTLALVFEAMRDPNTSFNLNSRVTIPEYINRVGRGIAVFDKLKAGQKFRARDLMIGAGSRSDAYSTLALALHLGSDTVYKWGGSESDKANRFIRLMNQKAAELGMNDTNFAVMTGLPNRRNKSTPHDIALLIAYIQKNFPRSAEIALGQPKFNIRNVSGAGTHTSRLLKARPSQIKFAKTGWTNAAGYCLGVLANQSGRELIGVVFGARDRPHRNAVMKQILSDAGQKLGRKAELKPD